MCHDWLAGTIVEEACRAVPHQTSLSPGTCITSHESNYPFCAPMNLSLSLTYLVADWRDTSNQLGGLLCLGPEQVPRNDNAQVWKT